MNIPKDLRYLDSHEYARKDGAEIVVGISDIAQDSLGDIVFVDLPKLGAVIARQAVFGVLESVKAASDLYLPISGTVLAVNTVLLDDPGLVNRDCYGQGWIVRIAPSDPDEWDALLDADAYEAIAAKD